MARFKNNTDHFISFAVPLPDGSSRWFSIPIREVIEVPDTEAWRAKANGLSEIGKSEVKPVEVKKKENEVIKELSKVKGLGKKVIEEIAEEYDSVSQIVADIKAKRFKVGGIDKKKQQNILKTFKY